MLAPLDNETIFKKAFTDEFVFTAFVKDILNIDFKVGKIESEKKFVVPVGLIDIKFDIFAESTDNRIIVEIQRMDYDYNFDRFLDYFLAAIIELQKNYKSYKIEKTVYTIVLITAPYIINKQGLPVKEEDFPEEYRELIRRLQKAANEPEIRKKMDLEDEIIEELEERERELALKEIIIEEQVKTIEEKDKAIEIKDKAIEEERKKRDENEKTIEELKRELDELRKQTKR